MRPIDADALREVIDGHVTTVSVCPTVDWSMGKTQFKKQVLEDIEAAPTIGKRGHWVIVHGYCTPGGDPVWKCSECGKGEHVYGVEHGTYGADIADGQWVTCPNCGAIMTGEKYE